MITGAAGAVAASAIFGDSVYPVGPFQWRVEWTPAWPGISELVFPPLGSVSAKTHVGPARLVASLESVDFQALAELIAAGPKGQEEGIQKSSSKACGRRFLSIRLVAWGLRRSIGRCVMGAFARGGASAVKRRSGGA